MGDYNAAIEGFRRNHEIDKRALQGQILTDQQYNNNLMKLNAKSEHLIDKANAEKQSRLG